ncbi:hypothetical protein BGZ63DRAFT_435621 [Mariannaea sp. PMI_226]|nr:hypothetical protein BGZ63DRAFT_435621 [Mariannaea sp. PMI_226]
MTRVAIAGATGGLGRTIMEAIVARKKHNVFALSRKQTGVFHEQPEVTVLAVNYSSPEDIAAILKINAIDTIVSCLPLHTEEDNQAQLNLIEGAAQSTTVTRFVPSEFGINYLEVIKANFPFPATEYKVAAVNKLRDISGIQYTRFLSGMFMDYYGPPQAPTRMNTMTIVIDHENHKAVVPGDGNIPVVLTHTTDVARFVAASLDLKEWPEASFIRGDKLTLNELVAIAESIQGCKYDISYDKITDLKAGKNTELPINATRYEFLPKEVMDRISQISGQAIANGWMDLNGPLLNDRFPELKPMSVKDFFERYAFN